MVLVHFWNCRVPYPIALSCTSPYVMSCHVITRIWYADRLSMWNPDSSACIVTGENIRLFLRAIIPALWLAPSFIQLVQGERGCKVLFIWGWPCSTPKVEHKNAWSQSACRCLIQLKENLFFRLSLCSRCISAFGQQPHTFWGCEM